MKRCKMGRIQDYIKNGPMLDYLVVMMALSLGASYFMVEGCAFSMIIAKTGISVIILGLWGMMAYTFMQTPFRIGKCIFAASITFVAQANLTMALTMDVDNSPLNLEVLAILFFLSCLIAGGMAELKHIMDVHHGKSKPPRPHP